MLIKIKNIEYRVLPHAKHRMDKRKVTKAAVIEALTHVKYSRKSESRGEKTRISVIGKNGVNVIYEESPYIIITVYNHKKEYYVNRHKERRNKNKLKTKRRYGRNK